MTVMTTSGTQKTIATIVRMAYQMAGLLEETQGLEQVNGGPLGYELLDTIVKDLQGEGIYGRAVGFLDVTLEADEEVYTLSASVIDTLGDGMYIAASETDTSRASGETAVTKIDRETWHRIGAKDATGNPTMHYVHRTTAPPVLYVWPIPDEAGTIRFLVHRHLADNSDGEATVDLDVAWEGYLIYELANRLAESKSLDAAKIGRLKSIADEKKMRAKGSSVQAEPNQIVIDHRTGWC
jgi:hypothetical protein